MADRSQPRRPTERRVLVLAVPDPLDTAIALHLHGDDDTLHFLTCAGEVDGAADSTSCEESELATAGHDLAADYRPTHLVVRDGSGASDDLARCRLFLEGALAGASSTIRYLVQAHPRPQAPSTTSYDTWLNGYAEIHGVRLDIYWHEPLTTTFLDCRGELQRVDDELAWQRADGPARSIARRLWDVATDKLERTATRNG